MRSSLQVGQLTVLATCLSYSPHAPKQTSPPSSMTLLIATGLVLCNVMATKSTLAAIRLQKHAWLLLLKTDCSEECDGTLSGGRPTS